MFLTSRRPGATGLIKALADDYITRVPDTASIEWVCNHSRNTQLALLHGYIDIALTYERDQESLAATEGWSVTAGCAFHDHFCLAGPSSDPAGLRGAASLQEGFERIAGARALFHSRADASATMWKERSIWSACGVEPWKDEDASSTWYQTSHCNPSEALTAADAAGAYLLTDRSTLLRQTALQTIHNTTVFFEPTSPNDVLMNSCHALTPSSMSAERSIAVSNFLSYLWGRGQDVIASFGKEELGGFALFAPVRDGFATVYLTGGLPRDGHWTIPSEKTKP